MLEKSQSPVAANRNDNRRPTRLLVALLALLILFFGALGGSLLTQQSARAQEGSTPTSISLYDDQNALADLYDHVSASVVNIRVVVDVASGTALPFELPDGFNLPDGFDVPQETEGQGSGFIYDNAGHIVTNNHVVEDAKQITVIFDNGFWADAELVAADPQADLAVLKVTPPAGMDWNPLPLAEPDTLRVGHAVIAIGNPFGLDGTMTTGIVSALERGMPIGALDGARYTLPDVIQTDAAINPGNSGGPLLNLDGEVVGVNFAIESPVRSNSGVGFTIPVSIVRRVVPALIEDGAFEYPYLGVSGQSITPQLAKVLELPDNILGVYVSEAVAGGPSDKAGVQGAQRTIAISSGGEFGVGGDIIVAINGEPVQRFEDLVGYLVAETSPGQTLTLTVLRDGESRDIDVMLGSRPATNAQLQTASGQVNAREAIQIAERAVIEANMLNGEIAEKVATPDTLNDADVWRVELSTSNQTAVVIVERATGDVLEMSVE